jgi:hypothetical protein
MSKIGGARPGAGRPAGQPNKATRELKELAQQYTEEAVLTLAEVMRNDEAPAVARVTAAVAILDRGHGKPRQQHEHTGADGKDLIPGPVDISKMAVGLLTILRGAASAAEGA